MAEIVEWVGGIFATSCDVALVTMTANTFGEMNPGIALESDDLVGAAAVRYLEFGQPSLMRVVQRARAPRDLPRQPPASNFSGEQ